MNFTLIITKEGTPENTWREPYYDDDIYSLAGAREACEEMIGEFNRTLRKGEVARILVDVVPIEQGDAVRPTTEQQEREQEERDLVDAADAEDEDEDE